MKKTILTFTFLIFCIFLAVPGQAADNNAARFSWRPNTESNLAGYRIHYGTTSGGPYSNVVNIGKPDIINGRVHGLVSNLKPDITYYFVVTAYNTSGLESPYSHEVACTAYISIPTPPNGLRILPLSDD
jgi:hypothetical protein